MIHDLYILIIDTYIKTLIFLSSVSLSNFIASCSEEIDNIQYIYQRENLPLENYIKDIINQIVT